MSSHKSSPHIKNARSAGYQQLNNNGQATSLTNFPPPTAPPPLYGAQSIAVPSQLAPPVHIVTGHGGQQVGHLSLRMITDPSHPRYGKFDDTFPIELYRKMHISEWQQVLATLDQTSIAAGVKALERKIRIGAGNMLWTSILTCGLSIFIWIPWHVHTSNKLRKLRASLASRLREAIKPINDIMIPRGVQFRVANNCVSTLENSGHPTSLSPTTWLEVGYVY